MSRRKTSGGNNSGGHDPYAATAAAWKKRQPMQVNVIVRVRPLLPHEKQQPLALEITQGAKRNDPSLVSLCRQNMDPVEFAFEKCYDGATTQRIFFQKEISPAVAGVFAGINTTVFAYGATGTGKTFTMEGSKKNLGMIPRCIKRLFEVANESKCTFEMDLSYLEIYNDRVLDLFVDKTQQMDLPIRQQTDGTIAVQGLTKKRITSLQDFEELYDKGSASRKKKATDLNPESSRSHSILMVHVRSTNKTTGEDRSGKLHLIDLAGSEDNRRTGNSGARLTESGKINMSLFVLGKVLAALNTGDIQRIPFRDSKLTRLLQDSLGGSSHAIMICNVAPTIGMYQESLQTLNYAQKARGIVNGVVINRFLNEKNVSLSIGKPTTPVGATSSKTANDIKNHTSLAVATPTNKSTDKKNSSAVAVGSSSAGTSTQSEQHKPKTPSEMEEKLLLWKQARQNGRNSIEKRESNARSSSIGIKRTATNSLCVTKVPLSSSTACRVSSASATTASCRVSAQKKPRVSLAPSPSLTFTRKTSFPTSSPKTPTVTLSSNGSPAADKENRNTRTLNLNKSPAEDKENQREDDKSVMLAKKLIGLAIDLEKKRHLISAYCVFKRAYQVLPEENTKLSERLKNLEMECPEAVAHVPSQKMSTGAYMQLILERDLMDILNKGDLEELTELHSIGDKRAEKIMSSRPFTQLCDLLQVHGITEKVLQKLRDHHTDWEKLH